MNMTELIQTSPIQVEQSTRTDELRCITSCRGGTIVPLAFVPLLREDRVSRGEVRVAFDMQETLYPLLNAVHVRCMAHFISPLAFERFAGGLESFNRSYQGVVEPVSGTAIPFFQTMAFNKAHMIWSKLGVQWKEGAPINSGVVEAYNVLVNWRRRARTDKLPERTLTDTTLAEAFWVRSPLGYIVPDWDQSAMEGEVGLSFVNSRVRARGLMRSNTAAALTGPFVIQTAGGSWATPYTPAAGSGMANYIVDRGVISNEADTTGAGGIFMELKDAGVTVSLANIELAKQTAAFAKLRERFDGIDDDHIVDLLMEGIRVPDEALKQPILLDSRTAVFGMSERKAMDGASLDMSLTTGRTEVGLRFRTPPMNTGGVILITAEIVPEQLYERQYDKWLGTSNPGTLPNFMRDFLDPEKVEVVTNEFVDVHHSTPTAVFGYAPLNHAWRRSITRAGGKFTRPNPDVFVEERQRFWSADQANPTLADDFYMVSDLPHTVFADTVADPFEVLTLGRVGIVGNTVFGDPLSEDTDSYEEIMADVDTGRIVQVPAPPATLEAPASSDTPKGGAQ